MRHFIDLLDWQSEEIRELIALAARLKAEWRNGGNEPILAGSVLGLIFQKPSLRTRVSFEVGMHHLGGTSLTLGPAEIGLGKRESIADISRVISRYVQIVMARVFDHAHVLELAQYSGVPVINGLSDEHHPCQAMADLLTIYERFGKLDGVRLVYVGDGNNVAVSLLQAAAHCGMNFAIATPPGYELSEEVLSGAGEIAAQTGASIETFHDPQTAVNDADVIYTDTWVSMGQEDDTVDRIEALQPYQVNAALLGRADNNAIVMHCLPAHRGHEITDEVADGSQSVIFDQAENRLHAQKAILATLLS
jgi:ornithine carbamoyltransferase